MSTTGRKVKEVVCPRCGETSLAKQANSMCPLCKELSKKEKLDRYWARHREKFTQDEEYRDVTRRKAREFYHSEKGRQYRQQEDVKLRRRNVLLKSKYGLTPEAYETLLKRFNYKCGIQTCNNTTELVVDHDHNCCPGVKSCGKCIRGILCKSCNAAIGKLGDSIEGISATLRYLTEGL